MKKVAFPASSPPLPCGPAPHPRQERHIAPMKATALYELIYNQLLASITSGKYPQGHRLPSEKELAELYHVSRITSQKALNMLAENGYILRLPGKGSFVNLPDGAEQALPRAKAAPAQRLIGYIVRGVGPSYGIHLLSSLEAECKQHGFVLALRFANSEEEEEQCIDDLLSIGACGLIVICIHGETYSERILRLVLDHYPIVLLDRGLQGIPASYVGIDNPLAASELTDYLLRMGKDKLCCVSCQVNQLDISVIADREQGFRAEIMRHGHLVDEENDFLRLEHEGIIRNQKIIGDNIDTITRYIQAHPEKNGYLCTSYDAAEEVLIALDQLGLKDGKQIVCFDQIDSLLLQHHFSHIKQNERAMGQEAIKILVQALDGDIRPKKVIVPHALVAK